ncbi:MAG: hypothetical protein R3F37_07705 [Candidatus Competibacteraceae bacterium]
MFNQPKSRQDLYDRIRRSSKDEFILEEMIRLGSAGGRECHDPADGIRRRGELQRELDALRTEHARLANEAAMLHELRKRRLAESRRKQQETRERRSKSDSNEQPLGNAASPKKSSSSAAVFRRSQSNRQCSRTPHRQPESMCLETPLDLAQAMRISLGELRFLAFHRRIARISHYQRFRLPKKLAASA